MGIDTCRQQCHWKIHDSGKGNRTRMGGLMLVSLEVKSERIEFLASLSVCICGKIITFEIWKKRGKRMNGEGGLHSHSMRLTPPPPPRSITSSPPQVPCDCSLSTKYSYFHYCPCQCKDEYHPQSIINLFRWRTFLRLKNSKSDTITIGLSRHHDLPGSPFTSPPLKLSSPSFLTGTRTLHARNPSSIAYLHT